jgi:hypothetical protein
VHPTHSFDPQTVGLLSSVLAEIVAEYHAQGLSVDEATRELVAHKIMDAASRRETDRNALKALALFSP